MLFLRENSSNNFHSRFKMIKPTSIMLQYHQAGFWYSQEIQKKPTAEK
jgi:hypothetical protein